MRPRNWGFGRMITDPDRGFDRLALSAPVFLLLALILLALAMLASVALGARAMAPDLLADAFLAYNPQHPDQQIMREVRLPRAIVGALVGSCFAMAGAMLQVMTRNPLASPSLMGLNSGASFALALTLIFLPGLPFNGKVLVSFVGAGLGAALVFGIGTMTREGLSPMRLVLAGAAVSALLGALTSGLIIFHGAAQQVLYWQAGGLGGVLWSQVLLIVPWQLVGLVGGLALARQMTVLGLGDEVATGLGQRVMLVRLAGTVLVVMLAGAAVALAGPIGFVGLIVPHLARYLVGADYRWVIPLSAVLGGLLLVLADLAARMINPPYELPVGFMTALIGVPFFLYLARRNA